MFDWDKSQHIDIVQEYCDRFPSDHYWIYCLVEQHVIYFMVFANFNLSEEMLHTDVVYQDEVNYEWHWLPSDQSDQLVESLMHYWITRSEILVDAPAPDYMVRISDHREGLFDPDDL